MYDRLTVPEASRALGLTEGAIRQRIQRGTLKNVRDEEGRVYVLVNRDDDHDDDHDDADKPPGSTRFNSHYNGFSETVEILKNQNEFLRDQLNQEREANRENRRIIAGLVQRVPELEAPSAAREGGEPTTERPGGTAEGRHDTDRENAPEPSEERHRSWWRRLIDG